MTQFLTLHPVGKLHSSGKLHSHASNDSLCAKEPLPLRLSDEFSGQVLKHNFPDSYRENPTYLSSLFQTSQPSSPQRSRASSSARVSRKTSELTGSSQLSHLLKEYQLCERRNEDAVKVSPLVGDSMSNTSRTMARQKVERRFSLRPELQLPAEDKISSLLENNINNSPRFTNAGLEEKRLVKKKSRGRLSDLRVVTKDSVSASWTAFGFEEEEISSSVSVSLENLSLKLDEDISLSRPSKNASPRWITYPRRMSKMLLSKKRTGTAEMTKSPLTKCTHSSADLVHLDSSPRNQSDGL